MACSLWSSLVGSGQGQKGLLGFLCSVSSFPCSTTMPSVSWNREQGDRFGVLGQVCVKIERRPTSAGPLPVGGEFAEWREMFAERCS